MSTMYGNTAYWQLITTLHALQAPLALLKGHATGEKLPVTWPTSISYTILGKWGIQGRGQVGNWNYLWLLTGLCCRPASHVHDATWIAEQPGWTVAVELLTTDSLLL